MDAAKQTAITSKRASSAPPKTILKLQRRNLFVLVISLAVLFWLIYALINHSKIAKQTVHETPAHFANPLKNVDLESLVLEKTANKLQDAVRNTENLQQRLEVLEKERSSYQKFDLKLSQLEQEITHLANIKEQQIKQQQNQSQKQAFASSPPFNTNADGNTFGSIAGSQNKSQEGIKDDEFQLAPNDFSSIAPAKNPDTYVPAGTFAKAVMIGAADVSAAVNSQNNPSPMLFRITAAGTLPNHAFSHLKNCVVTAAAVGDISSERGMVRLETLSCTKPDGDILDIPVEGTIFGPEGKNGIRGRPVWREGALLQRAFTAGTLSGFSGALSQHYTTQSISPLGATQTVNGSDVFKYGAASGASKAMDRLADYNIQRAEQYHPVIQLSAGTTVDVVFLKGFYLDGKKHQDKEEKAETNAPSLFSKDNNDGSQNGQNLASLSSLNAPNIPHKLEPLPLTPTQIARLKEHAAELGFKNQEEE